VRLLLDTHIALWAITGDQKLNRSAQALIDDIANGVFVSAVSLFEIAIKRLRRPGSLAVGAGEALRLFEEAGYSMLPVSASHAAAVEALPLLHADPFDRLLAAQALTEPLRLITHDRKLASYSETFILA
jgi:PIN domain nuclease of toxin-antitoxin system